MYLTFYYTVISQILSCITGYTYLKILKHYFQNIYNLFQNWCCIKLGRITGMCKNKLYRAFCVFGGNEVLSVQVGAEDVADNDKHMGLWCQTEVSLMYPTLHLCLRLHRLLTSITSPFSFLGHQIPTLCQAPQCETVTPKAALSESLSNTGLIPI